MTARRSPVSRLVHLPLVLLLLLLAFLPLCPPTARAPPSTPLLLLLLRPSIIRAHSSTCPRQALALAYRLEMEKAP